jgi:DNA-binding NtrC family response regulator
MKPYANQISSSGSSFHGKGAHAASQPTVGIEDAFIIGSAMSRDVMHRVELAQSAADAPVLITGESGTGKELVARSILQGGPRCSRPFIPINCSAIPSDLAESLFFGHSKGAFTGAVTDEIGYFQLADTGTLYLDEIADMPLHLQTKLLCVLDSNLIRPVGSRGEIKVDVRIIAATNSDLASLIEKGEFRSDLYYRLAVLAINVPPLRQRKEEIAKLADYFVQFFTSDAEAPQPAITPEVLSRLQQHDYPGNVRELKNIIQRAVIASGGHDISVQHLDFLSPLHAKAQVAGDPCPLGSVGLAGLPLNIDQAEAELIVRALQKAEGNVSEAARMLGIARTKLYRKMATVPVARAIHRGAGSRSLRSA